MGISVFINLLIERYRRSERLIAAYKEEQAYRKAERQYRNLFNSMDEGFCIIEMIFDLEGKPADYRFLEVNPAFEKQAGLHEAVGKRMREFAPSHEAYWFEIFGKIALTGEPAHFFNEAKALNRFYEVSAYRVGESELRHVAIVFSDISGRKRAEEDKQRLLETVQQEKDTLSALINAMDDEVWFIDVQKKIALANPTALSNLGLELSPKVDLQELGKRVEFRRTDGSLRPIEESPPFRALNGEVIRNEEETLRFSATGEFMHRELNAAPIMDASGSIIGALAVVRDITSRKEDEAHIRKLNRVYTVLSGINETIVRVKDSNAMLEAACSIAVNAGKFRMAWIGMINPETQVLEPVASSGAVDGYLDLVKIDILDPSYATGPTVQCIAHDFNNLLAVIIGNLDLLERQVKDNEPAMKRVHTARNASFRGAELTRRLLAFARQETLQPKAIDLNAVIGTVLELAAPALGPEIKVITRLHPSIPAVFVDASGLENALLNLVVNARDAMEKRGTLTISSELRNLESGQLLGEESEFKPGDYAFVAVSDTGQGMTKETAQRVFEPFFTTKSNGTGLGLAMVYGFIKQSSGSVGVDSEPGRGTTFSLFLPLVEDAVKLPFAPILEVHSRDAAGSTILVVDDEDGILEIASTCLGELGYTVLTAGDGASAKRLIEERDDIALLLTDVIMPGEMTGVELAECAVKINPLIRIIYCSGFPTEALAERNITLAEDSLLRKPYQCAELISIVRKALASAPAGV